jgi:hypothetical protein
LVLTQRSVLWSVWEGPAPREPFTRPLRFFQDPECDMVVRGVAYWPALDVQIRVFDVPVEDQLDVKLCDLDG